MPNQLRNYDKNEGYHKIMINNQKLNFIRKIVSFLKSLLKPTWNNKTALIVSAKCEPVKSLKLVTMWFMQIDSLTSDLNCEARCAAGDVGRRQRAAARRFAGHAGLSRPSRVGGTTRPRHTRATRLCCASHPRLPLPTQLRHASTLPEHVHRSTFHERCSMTPSVLSIKTRVVRLFI